MRVVGPEGEMLGVLATSDAIRMAMDRELDLVEVNPKGVPPVCKIMDFNKYRYEEKKKEKEAKRKQIVVEIKEIKLRANTDVHDFDVKVKHIRRFLEDGNKVRCSVRLRGREEKHPETAMRQLEEIIERTKDLSIIEQPPKADTSKQLSLVIGPKPEVRSKATLQVIKRVEGSSEDS